MHEEEVRSQEVNKNVVTKQNQRLEQQIVLKQNVRLAGGNKDPLSH